MTHILLSLVTFKINVMPNYYTSIVSGIKAVSSSLIVLLVLAPAAIIAQDKCTIQYSGKLYTTKSDLPINCHRPGIDDKNFTYDTTPIKEESETAAIPLKQTIMFVDEIAGWFVVFDKKDHLCSSESVFVSPSGEYNFTALTKKNELIRGFVPNVYLNRIDPSSYPAYANSLKQGSPEQIMVSDLVVSVGMVRNDNYKVSVHVNASELKGYQSRLLELLSLPQEDQSAKGDVVASKESEGQKPVATNEKAEEKELAKSESSTESKTKPAKPAKVKKVKQKKEKAPKPAKEKKTSTDSSTEIAEETKEEEKEEPVEDKKTEVTKEPESGVEKDAVETDHVAEIQSAVDAKEVDSNNKSKESMVEEPEAVAQSGNPEKVTSSDSEVLLLETGQSNLGKRYVPKDNPEMTEADKEEISEIAMIQLKRLEDTFKTLVDRNINAHIKKKMRENTVQTLFVNDKAEVSVSSAARSAVTFHFIPDYLERLEKMFYQRVEIDFSDIHKVTDLKKNPDGTWTGIVTFTQVFKGYDQVDGLIPRYGDITHKSVTIIVRKVETFSGDARPDVEWIVLLGDIGVNETQKL
jgi:hypothetical protein